jgi:hypothetical protein
MDSSSLGEFKVCPRKYYYSIVLGRQPQAESIHLTFGILLHRAIELYHKQRVTQPHYVAMRRAVLWAMESTWDAYHNKPWDSDDKYKNRFTLIRTLVWYLDEYEHEEVTTATMSDGKVAVELPFSFDSGYTASTGEDFVICGTLDRIVLFHNRFYVMDVKTTKSTIGQYYFKKYTPDNQVTIYSIAGSMIFHQPIEGLIIDACQVAIEKSVFARDFIDRSPYQRDEWQRNLGYWLLNINNCAETDNWPKNDTACDRYGGCPFRPVCSQPNEAASARMLEGAYRDRTWDPHQNRTSF